MFKQIIYIALWVSTLCLIFSVSIYSGCGQSTKQLSIEDKIKEYYDKTGGELTEQDLDEIENLHISNRYKDNNKVESSDVELLKKCRYLKSFGLYGYDIGSLEPISDLNHLTSLSLQDCGISDISPIAKMTNLYSVYLSTEHIKDFSPLSELKNLKLLSIPSSKITSLDFLQDSTEIVGLYLNCSTIENIDVLSEFKSLEKLDISNTKVHDISPLKDLPNLKMVKLEGLTLNLNSSSNILPEIIRRASVAYDPSTTYIPSDKLLEILVRKRLKNKAGELTEDDYKSINSLLISGYIIDDLSPIKRCSEIVDLEIGGCHLKDISALRNLNKLNKLNLTCNEIENIEPLSNLTNLIELNLSSNKVSDITPLSLLEKLEQLRLYDNNVNSLEALRNNKNLKRLVITGNPISDISPVGELHNLECFIYDMMWNELKRNITKEVCGLSELGKLNKLKYLCIRNAGITDISIVENMESLQELRLDFNDVSDLLPLTKLKHLISIQLFKNKIEDISPLIENKNIKEHCRIELSHNPLCSKARLVDIRVLRERGCTVKYKNR
ncbi:hypothetical protein J7L05_03160 [bacterium]|nr:hypothetical protein [bacterium]